MEAGSRVLIKKLNRDGIIISIDDKGRYKVSLGGLTMLLSSDEISPAESLPQKDRDHRKSSVAITPTDGKSLESEALDLHGYTVAEAMIALESKINRAIMTNQNRLKIVHGLGSGKVMNAVHEYLKQSTLVANFRVDNFNPGQTWVWL